MKQNLLFILNLLTMSLFVCSAIIIDKEPLFAIFGILWSIYYFVKSNKHLMKINAFTLIELIAVISILSILLSIVMSFKTSPTKAESAMLNSCLIQAKTYSYDYDFPIEFKVEGNYKSKITSTAELFFKKGIATDKDGHPLIGFKFKITDKNGKEEPIELKIKPFTGKITFY